MLPASIAQYRNFKIYSPPPPQPDKPWVFDYFMCPGSWEFDWYGLPMARGGKFDLYLSGVGKIEL